MSEGKKKKTETDNCETNRESGNDSASLTDLISHHSDEDNSFTVKLDNIGLNLDSSNDSVVSMKEGETENQVSYKDLFTQKVRLSSSAKNVNNNSASVSGSEKRKASVSPEQCKVSKKPAKTTFAASTSSARVASTIPPNPAAMPQLRTAASQQPPYISLQNRFTLLQDESDVDDEPAPNTTASGAPCLQQQKPQRPPSAIIIPGTVTNHTALVTRLQTNIKKGFNIRYTRNNVSLYVKDKEEKTKFLETIQELEYHTYTDSDKKTHAFVLRGLDCDPTPDLIKTELSNTYKLDIQKVFKMNTKYRPLYLVVTDAGITLKDLQNSVKYILYTRITWERHVSRKVLTQCHRCQNWGHATANCNRAPRCVKCGKGHITSTCSKSPDTPATCANCGGAHPANYTECPTYLHQIELASKHNNKIKERYEQLQHMREARASGDVPHYVPAPTPAVNAWTRADPQQSSDQNILTSGQFPPLPSQRAQARRPSVTQPTPCPIPPSTTQLRSSSSSKPQPQTLPPRQDALNVNVFQELAHHMNELKSLVNLENLLMFVKDYTLALRSCHDSQNRSLTAFSFLQSIHSYNI